MIKIFKKIEPMPCYRCGTIPQIRTCGDNKNLYVFQCPKCGNKEEPNRYCHCPRTAAKAWNEYTKWMMYFLKLMNDDVAFVVRCKDCKYAREPDRENRYESKACEGVLICSAHETVLPGDCGLVFVDEEHFCAYGVRKEGG